MLSVRFSNDFMCLVQFCFKFSENIKRHRKITPNVDYNLCLYIDTAIQCNKDV